MTTRAVLFDLDGTLAHTAPDLGDALNALRGRHSLPPLPEDQIRAHVSGGAAGLLALGFNVAPADPSFAPLRDSYLEIYRECLGMRTRFFPGIPELLAELEARNIPWGIVTNKPARFTLPLLTTLGLLERAASVVSGDTCSRPKPDPQPLFHAARETGVEPSACLFLGDAQRDIEAARAAGMRPIVARYGYLAATDRPESWGAAALIDAPAELLRWL